MTALNPTAAQRAAKIEARAAAIAAAGAAFGAKHVMSYREAISWSPAACIELGRGLQGSIYGRGRSIEGARRSLMRILESLGGAK